MMTQIKHGLSFVSGMLYMASIFGVINIPQENFFIIPSIIGVIAGSVLSFIAVVKFFVDNWNK